MRSFLFSLLVLFCGLTECANAQNVSLIKNSHFTARDGKGNPSGWWCASPDGSDVCLLEQDKQGHTSLVLPRGTSLMTSIKMKDHTQGIHLAILTKEKLERPTDITLMTLQGIVYPAIQHINQEGVLSESVPLSGESERFFLSIHNASQQTLHIHMFDVYQGGINPAPEAGVVAKAIYSDHIKAVTGSDIQSLWIPLPLDYAGQVPLNISLQITPNKIVKQIHYQVDKAGNFGAIVDLVAPLAVGAQLAVHWEGTILLKSLNEKEKTLYDVDQGIAPSAWLSNSEIVQSDNAEIAKVAKTLTQNDADLSQKIAHFTGWERDHLLGFSEDMHNDALYAFTYLQANCTGFSNLGSAFGRSLQIPSRSLANIMLGFGSLSMHFINEFYSDAEGRWVRIEPQMGNGLEVSPFYTVAVRKILPETDETELAYKWANVVEGTPLYSLTTVINAPGTPMEGVSEVDTFPDCPSCSTRADLSYLVMEEDREMSEIFNLAKSNWKKDMNAYLQNGRISEKRQSLRSSIERAKNSKELLALLRALNMN